MGTCNTTQNERSGKDLLLKICEDLESVDVAIGTDDDPTKLLATAHGLVVGDMVRITSAELGTVDDITADQLYFVISKTDDDFSISATPDGSAITFTNALTDATFEVFKTIGGLRTGGNSFASEAIDITNYGSNNWRQIKDGAGLKSVSVSGEGVYNNSTNYKAMESSAFANTLVCLAFVDVTQGRVYHGCYKITAIEASAEHNGEATFSMSAESSGEITIYQAA